MSKDQLSFGDNWLDGKANSSSQNADSVMLREQGDQLKFNGDQSKFGKVETSAAQNVRTEENILATGKKIDEAKRQGVERNPTDVSGAGRKADDRAGANKKDSELNGVDDEAEADIDAGLLRKREARVFSVSEITRQIKGLLEGEFGQIWVRGEISNFKAHTSGHYYFSLKDDKAQINAVMFRGFAGQLKFRPESGMEVIVRGRVTVFEPRGNYQIFCEFMEPVGAGALQLAFEQLKAKLKAEGLFDVTRKRALPSFPQHIAIVTSPTGAAIRDMINVLSRRFRGLRITVVPTKVQGEDAPAEIVTAIALANRINDVDVIIIGRGGGSMEDLWGFNNEAVARAIAACRVPTISGVGHEVDFTIADFVADVRAPTPSAAAELVVKNAGDIAEKVKKYSRNLLSLLKMSLQSKNQRVDSLAKRLVDPKRHLQDLSMRLDDSLNRLENAILRCLRDQRQRVKWQREKLGNPMVWINKRSEGVNRLFMLLKLNQDGFFQRQKNTWARLSSMLDGLSPLKVVERGYSIVKLEDQLIKDTKNLKVGDVLDIEFSKGRIKARVEEVKK